MAPDLEDTDTAEVAGRRPSDDITVAGAMLARQSISDASDQLPTANESTTSLVHVRSIWHPPTFIRRVTQRFTFFEVRSTHMEDDGMNGRFARLRALADMDEEEIREAMYGRQWYRRLGFLCLLAMYGGSFELAVFLGIYI
jgi:hypothetical protein